MSNILELLNQIKTAIYGRDVRQAIHDAIRQCYDDGHAGSIDPTARELITAQIERWTNQFENFKSFIKDQLDTFEESAEGQIAAMHELIQAQMSEFVSSHGTVTATLIEETILYEVNPASGPSAKINVSQTQLAEYDYIDIYYKIAGTYKRHVRLKPDMLSAEINLDPITYSNGEKSIIMYEPVLAPNQDGSKLVLNVNRWAWNGTASAAATLRAAAEQATGIYKIVGIKHISSSADKDAELSDLRIAPDGTIKASAGAMVREEVSKIYAEFVNKVNKPEISPNGTAGQLLRTNGDGTTTWIDAGLPTDEQTEAAVDGWLRNHPEATTTVQDGTITKAKLANALLESIEDSAINFNLTRVTMLRNTICGDGDHYLQGGVYVSSTDHFVFAFTPISGSGATDTIMVEMATDFATVIKRVSGANYGHCNDITYNPNTNKIYCSSTGQASGSQYERKVVVLNALTLEIESSVPFENLVSAISYDRINDVYYTVESVASGRAVFKYDSSFNLIEELGEAYLIDPARQVGECSVAFGGKFYYATASNYKNHSVWINTFGANAKIWQMDNFAYYEPESLIEYDGAMYLVSIKSTTYIYVDRIGTDRTVYNRTEERYLRGTLLITGADLNDVKDTGRYYITESSATTIINAPYTMRRQFSMDVLHVGYDGICQVLTVNNRMVFMRTFINNSWTEWASVRSGRKFVGKTLSTGNFYTAGFVTDAGKSVRFSIPAEIERDVNVAEVTAGSIRLLQGGNIVLDTSDILETFDTITATVSETGLSFIFMFETAPENIIHNETIGIQLYSMIVSFDQ